MHSLVSISARPSRQWVDQHLHGSQINDNKSNIIKIFLETDLKTTSNAVTAIGDDFYLSDDFELKENILVQINEVVDISLPSCDRIRLDEDVKCGTLKLLMSDGFIQFFGIAKERLSHFSPCLHPGAKATLRRGATAKYGVFLLCKDDISIVGGRSCEQQQLQKAVIVFDRTEAMRRTTETDTEEHNTERRQRPQRQRKTKRTPPTLAMETAAGKEEREVIAAKKSFLDDSFDDDDIEAAERAEAALLDGRALGPEESPSSYSSDVTLIECLEKKSSCAKRKDERTKAKAFLDDDDDENNDNDDNNDNDIERDSKNYEKVWELSELIGRAPHGAAEAVLVGARVVECERLRVIRRQGLLFFTLQAVLCRGETCSRESGVRISIGVSSSVLERLLGAAPVVWMSLSADEQMKRLESCVESIKAYESPLLVLDTGHDAQRFILCDKECAELLLAN